jgi:hypothetical protein
MPDKINLLPKEPRRSKEVDRFLRLIKNATYFIAIFFIFAGPVSGLLIFKFTRDLGKLKAENETLRASITNLESTEQGLVLLKDRITKIQTILASRQSVGLHAKQTEVVASLPDGLSFQESELGNDVSRISLLAVSSQALQTFLKSVSANDHYLSLILSGFTFNPYLGYTFDLQVF